MPLSHAIKIMFSNFTLVLKTMIYKISAAILAASVVLVFAYNHLKTLSSAGAFSKFSSIPTKGSLQNIFLAVRDAIVNFWNVLVASNVTSEIIGCAILFMFLLCFLLCLDEIAQGEVLYAKLSSNCKVSYSGSFLKKIGQAALYSLFKMVYVIICCIFIALIFAGLSNMLDINGFFGKIAPFIMIFVFLVITAVCFTFFGGHTAAMFANDGKIFKNFIISIKRAWRAFFRLFLLNFLLVTLIVFMNYVFAMVFFGVFLLITIPMSFTLTAIFNQICYFEASGNRYYLDANTIISPKKNEYYDKVRNLIDLL